MKRLWIGLFVFCLAVTAAQAGTVHKYEFLAEITDVDLGGTVISEGDEITGWVEIHEDYLPTDSKSSDSDEAWYLSPPGQGFIKWHVEVAGEDYTQNVLPTSSDSTFADSVFVVNGATSTDEDSLNIISTRNTAAWSIDIMFENEDGTAIASEALSIVPSAWDTITFKFTLDSQTARGNPDLKFTAVAIPLPSAAWIGLALLGALGVIRRIRRR